MTVFMNSRILSNNLNERAYWSKTKFLLARRRRDCCCLCVVVVFDGIVSSNVGDFRPGFSGWRIVGCVH
jgi:hypothetical protein